MLTIEIKDVNGIVIGKTVCTQTTFKTGSRGYKATPIKVFVGGLKHQLCGVNIVEVHSKDADQA